MTPQDFVNKLNDLFKSPTYPRYYRLEHGRKYIRVVCTTVGSSAYCFLDFEGNVYKAAGWKVPAKGVRATLATLDMSTVDQYGSWLYRK